MLERMRRALTRPRGEAKRRRASGTSTATPTSGSTAPTPAMSAGPAPATPPSPIQQLPSRARTPSEPVTPPPAAPLESPSLTETAVGTPPPPPPPPLPPAGESDAGALSDEGTVPEPTPARASLMRAASEADVDAAELLHPAARAAVYTAYTDALHKEARSSCGGLRRVVELLREHERNPVVVENAALAIAVLSENDPATRDVFGQYGAVEALLYTLALNERFAPVVERVLFAVANLVRDSPRNVRLLETFDGVGKLAKISASKRFESAPAVAVYALTALAALKHRLGVHDARVVLKGPNGGSKVVTYVLRAMRLHEHRAPVQEAGLDAVRTLVVRADRSVLPAALLTKCVRAAATAYRLHKDSKDVQWQTLALQCDIDDIRDGHFLVELDVDTFFGSLKAIVTEGSAMRKNERPSSANDVMADAIASLISRALATASRVGWRSIESKNTAVDAGAVDVCIETLAAFSDDRQIVEKTCSVMRSLFDSLEGRMRLDSVPTACALLSAIETTCKTNTWAVV